MGIRHAKPYTFASPCVSSDTSEGSENSGSFKDSGSSYEEYFEDGASYKEGGSKTLQVQRSTRESKAPVRVLIFVEDSWNEEPCRDVHQVGDVREVEVLRSFSWPPSELITKDGVLPERGAIYHTEVSTEVYVGAIYPNKVVSEPGYDKQRQKTEPLAKAKPTASRVKEVNMAARDFDDLVVCCAKNTVEDCIMDSGALFHATYCKEKLERFKLRSGKVRLADAMTLDIADIRDVVLKTYFGEAFLHDVSVDKETTETTAEVTVETPLQFGVAEILSRTFRAESTRLRVEAPKMLWADSVSTTYLIYRIPYVLIGEAMKCTFIGSSSDAMRNSFQDTKSHQSPGVSSDTSEGYKNSRSFEDSGRSDEEYSEDGASSKEGGSMTPQRMVNPSYSEALSIKKLVHWKKAIIEEMVSLEKNQMCSLVRISAGKKAS
ncbi:hypothetical protein Tco_0718455 [Tanacetum coccineum]